MDSAISLTIEMIVSLSFSVFCLSGSGILLPPDGVGVSLTDF
jgi:hypothetical protein